MTFNQYIDNPMGKSNAVFSQREAFKAMYSEKFDKVLVKENGTLSYLSYNDLVNKGEVNLKNIDNLQNVVSVVENTYTMIAYVIGLDGTEFSLYDYIK